MSDEMHSGGGTVENSSHPDGTIQGSGKFEAQLAKAFRQTARSMAIVSAHGRFLEVNQAFCDLTGYTSNELLSCNFQDILHPDDHHLHGFLTSRTNSQQVNFDLIERYRRKDGQTIWVRNFSTLVSEKETEDVVVSMIQDITEEKNVREQERRMHFLIDNSSDYISLTDAEERIVYLNKAGRKMLGIPPDEVNLMPSMDLATVQERQRLIREIIPKVEETGYWEGALNLMNQQTGDDIPVHVKSLRISDSVTGAPAGRATVIHDLRPELAARAVSKEREENLQRAVDLAQIGTWTVDLSNQTISYSARVIDMLGLPVGSRPYDEMQGIHPEDREAVTQEFDRAVAEGCDGLFDIEHRTIHEISGEIRFVHNVGKVICDRKGEPSMVIGTLQDITEQKIARQALEEQIASNTRELFHANRRLQDLNSFLQQSNAELEQFAYVASHDLQEPLRKISIFAGMLSQYADMPQQALGTVEKIGQASGRMMQLIRDLLDFSRLLNTERRLVNVDLNQIVNMVLNDFELTIAEKSALVHVDELPVIEAVPVQMNQLFCNLVGNALKFVRAGVPPEIVIRCRRLEDSENAAHDLIAGEQEYYFITVTDNGIGFDSKYAEQIFEVFKRLHTPLEFPGSGIGLALCRRILQNHGGIMTAHGEVGAGTTISLILPSTQLSS
jgi:PAS domain S-box-containing protein